MNSTGSLEHIIAGELDGDVMAAAQHLGEELAHQAGSQAMAVLFYGSCLRTGDEAGLMDFYLLVEDSHGYGDSALARLAHRLAPPHVRYFKSRFEGRPVHAKVAVMTLARFAALCRPQALDISIWARFTQPCALIYARDATIRTRIYAIIRDAVTTAMGWSVGLGPRQGSPKDYWQTLFRATYRAELRIDEPGRADQIVAFAGPRYVQIFQPALRAAAIEFSSIGEGLYAVHTSISERRARHWRWVACRLFSKSINAARILKGALTFEGRTDYVAWKLERRTGITLELTPWQRSHPVLAIPRLLAQMWSKGAFRPHH